MTTQAQPQQILNAVVALALTIGFMWTDLRAAFPWFDAIVQSLAG